MRIESSSTRLTALHRRPFKFSSKRAAESLVTLANEGLEVPDVALHQVNESHQVVGHAAQDLIFLEVLGNRDFHCAVERQLALVNLLEHVDNQSQREVALEHLAAEFFAGDLDPLGQVDFLLAGQERYLTHLGQIHANRVVNPSRNLVEVFRGQLGFVVVGLVDVVFRLVIQVARGQEAAFRLVLVDQLDAHFIERLEQAVDALGARRLIRQIVVDLVKRQESTTLAQIEKRFESLIQLVHPKSSPAQSDRSRPAS